MYPAAGSSYVLVTEGSEQFEFYYFVLPSAATIAKAFSYSHTTSFSNLFKIEIESSIIAESSGGVVEIGFSSSDFTNTLGTATTDDQTVDCSSTINSLTRVYCSLQEGISTSYNYRPLLSRVRLHNQIAETGNKKIMIPNIINPSTASLNLNIRIKIFTLTGSVENIIADELIYYVLGTTSSVASIINTNSFLVNENNIAVGYSAATFQVSTDISSFTITSADHVF